MEKMSDVECLRHLAQHLVGCAHPTSEVRGAGGKEIRERLAKIADKLAAREALDIPRGTTAMTNVQAREAIDAAYDEQWDDEEGLFALANDLTYVKAMVRALVFLDGGVDRFVKELDGLWPEREREAFIAVARERKS